MRRAVLVSCRIVVVSMTALTGLGMLIGGQLPAAAAEAASRPGAPTAVSGRSVSHGALLSWKAPAVTGGSPVTGYLIRASPGGKQVRTAAVTKFVVGGLLDGRGVQIHCGRHYS